MPPPVTAAGAAGCGAPAGPTYRKPGLFNKTT